MNTDARYVLFAVAVDYLIAKRHSTFVPPRLAIVHGYRKPGTICLPGETLDRCMLRLPEWELPIPLSLPGLMICDCMVRHHRTPLTIARMERILTNDPFYRRLGANAFERIEKMPMFTRVAIRVYITRLRQQIAKALRKGGSMLSPDEVVISEPTDSNVVVHRISLPVEIVHQPMKLM